MNNEIGRRIRYFRNACGISQLALGKELGVSFQQIQKYEAGTNRLHADKAIKISKIFNIPLTELLPCEESKIFIPPLSATALNIAILYDKLSKGKQNMLLKIAQIMREEGDKHD